MPEFSLQEELRFLAAQCSAKAQAAQGDEDDLLFLARLTTRLVVLGDGAAIRATRILIDDAERGECPRDMIRLAGTILNDRAARLERRLTPGMGDAA